MKNKMISIEGIDGSGKSTQINLLIKHLHDCQEKVKTIHFPQHGHGVFGKLIDEYLTNSFGPANKIDSKLIAPHYAADRFAASKKINKWLSNGYWVILDRYTESNFGHQGGKIKNAKQREKAIKWLYNLDYKFYQNPKPDLVIFLDIPVKFTIRAMEKMKKKLDAHEASHEFLKNSRQAYLQAAKMFNYWESILCIKNNQRLTPQQIHNKIWKLIYK